MSVARTVRIVMLAVLATALLAPASEAGIKKGRGTIQSVDWNVMQMAIKGVDSKVNTFRVAPDCGVVFTDGAEYYSKRRDLQARMYVYFDFEDYNGQEAGMIQKVEVREIPKDMLPSSPTAAAQAASTATQLKVKILEITNAGKGEFRADVAGRAQNFRAQVPADLRAYRKNDFVVITVQSPGSNVVTAFVRSTP